MATDQATRVASGAQRSGAATLRLIYLRDRQKYCATLAHDCAFSFFVARTPARWLQKRLWASVHRGGHGPGGAVLQFYTGRGVRTANPLENRGSVVLFYSPTRDACTGACAHTCKGYLQNHRTIEPHHKTKHIQGFDGSDAVLCRFYAVSVLLVASSMAGALDQLADRSNKIEGGNAAAAPLAVASADQGLFAASAGAKFRRRARLAGAAAGSIGADRDGCAPVGRNGGFPRVSGASREPVGMAMLEWSAESGRLPSFSGWRQKPVRLWPAVAWAPRGGGSSVEGGTPPNAARLVLRSQAQPVFWVSTQSAFRGSSVEGLVRDGRVTWSTGMGSGDRRPRDPSTTRRGNAGRYDLANRVGDGGVSCASPMRQRVAQELWAGGAHVN